MSSKTGAGMRLLSFFVSRLSILIVLALIIVLAFFVAYDLANIYVTLDDGLTQRADIILNNDEPLTLDRFFTYNYLQSDPMLSFYQDSDYLINSYDYNVDIVKLWVWPWQSTTRVEILEYIPDDSWRFGITDRFRQRLTEIQMPPEPEEPIEDEEQEEFVLDIPSPQWQNGKKEVYLRKIGGQWKIDSIVFLENIDPAEIK